LRGGEEPTVKREFQNRCGLMPKGGLVKKRRAFLKSLSRSMGLVIPPSAYDDSEAMFIVDVSFNGDDWFLKKYSRGPKSRLISSQRLEVRVKAKNPNAL
jgi:hypothetical protein